jgi:hypothetical protein
LRPRTADVAAADVRRDQLVVTRRHDHLDVVVEDDRHRVEQVLLVGTVEQRRRALRRLPTQLIDELVDPARGDCARRGAREHLSARQAHATAGPAG